MSGGGIQRRTALRRLAWGALVPFAALGAPPGLVQATGRRITIPVGAFRLERVLTRGLNDAAAIVVTRRWRIAFARTGIGTVVNGEQTFADVAAPEGLAPLAAIERSRSASGVFPLTIDAEGLIAEGSVSQKGEVMVRALETGRALVNSLPLLEATRLDARSFMAQLSMLSAGTVSRLPRDLFFPQPGGDTITREIALPGGETGSIAVTARARAAVETGLLIASERLVVTRLADSERIASEHWSLTAV